MLFLYDVKEEKLYPVFDHSLRTTSSSYQIFTKDSEDYLFFDQWYIEYYEEEIVLEQKDFDYLNNSFKIIEVNKFIEQIKAGNKNTEYFKIINMTNNELIYASRVWIQNDTMVLLK